MLKENNLKPEREMTMLYLIMRCDELNDQYECDADRKPIAIVEDWAEWTAQNPDIDYQFEIWEYDENTFECIKSYDQPLEWGMALYYWEDGEDCENDKPHIIARFPNRTKDDSIPLLVEQTIAKGAYTDYEQIEKGINHLLEDHGAINWWNKNHRYYVYGRYEDGWFDCGY